MRRTPAGAPAFSVRRATRAFLGGWGLLWTVCVAAAVGASTPGRPSAPATPDAYVQAVLASHPSGFWRLDDPAGSRVARATAGNVNGAYRGSPQRVRALDGFGRRFDGLSSYLQIPDDDRWSEPTTGALTVEFWMRPDRLTFSREEGSGYVWILGKGQPNEYEWGFRMYGLDNRESPPRSNRIAFYAFNAAGGEGAGAYFQVPISLDRWIFIVGELTTSGVLIYRDGVLTQGPPAPATLYSNPRYNITPSNGTAPVRVGTRNSGSFFAGGIDDLAIFPTLLTQTQIRRHYEAGRVVQGLKEPPHRRA